MYEVPRHEISHNQVEGLDMNCQDMKYLIIDLGVRHLTPCGMLKFLYQIFVTHHLGYVHQTLRLLQKCLTSNIVFACVLHGMLDNLQEMCAIHQHLVMFVPSVNKSIMMCVYVFRLIGAYCVISSHSIRIFAATAGTTDASRLGNKIRNDIELRNELLCIASSHSQVSQQP